VTLWYPELATGHDVIDAQHRAVCSAIELLRVTRFQVDVQHIIDDLGDHFTAHFGEEEALMVRVGYPEADIMEHRMRHLEFFDVFINLRARLRAAEFAVGRGRVPRGHGSLADRSHLRLGQAPSRSHPGPSSWSRLTGAQH
jgi:hemerythrin-like metal-binding protein